MAMKKEIYASDISESVLNSARAAVYGSYSVRNIPENYLKKYFTNTSQQYQLATSVKSLVKLMKVNLIDDKESKTIRGMDVVFCRNVLIYFDKPTQLKVPTKLSGHLREGGYLVLGHSESGSGHGLPMTSVANTIFQRR
jgi:chemotaxis protein methyltransferase CheR